MASQTQSEIPLGLKKLQALDKVSVLVGKKQPRGEYTVASEGGEVLFTSTQVLKEFEVGCGSTRWNSFYIELSDASKQQIISLRRAPSLSAKLQVHMGGVLVATVHRYPTFRKPILLINNEIKQPVLRIKGPVSYQTICNFDLQSMTKMPIGAITKLWSPLLTPNAMQDYNIVFPKDLDVKFKAAVLGASFLIDFLCSENSW